MLKKLRSIFIIDEEDSAKSPSSGADSAQTSPAPAVTSSAIDNGGGARVRIEGGEVSERFLNILLEALDRHDLEGFDYMEFKKFLKSLDKVDLDEATKFRTAFATGQTMGASKENLVSSAERYLNVLKQEEARFEEAVEKQRTTVVQEKQSGIADLEKSISTKEAEIARMAAEIEKAKQEIHARREEVAQAQAKIQQTQSDFAQTYHHLMTQLQDDVRKINQYIS